VPGEIQGRRRISGSGRLWQWQKQKQTWQNCRRAQRMRAETISNRKDQKGPGVGWTGVIIYHALSHTRRKVKQSVILGAVTALREGNQQPAVPLGPWILRKTHALKESNQGAPEPLGNLGSKVEPLSHYQPVFKDLI